MDCLLGAAAQSIVSVRDRLMILLSVTGIAALRGKTRHWFAVLPSNCVCCSQLIETV